MINTEIGMKLLDLRQNIIQFETCIYAIKIILRNPTHSTMLMLSERNPDSGENHQTQEYRQIILENIFIPSGRLSNSQASDYNFSRRPDPPSFRNEFVESSYRYLILMQFKIVFGNVFRI